MPKKVLTAENLKDLLWSTMNDVKNRRMKPPEANAVATQAREICRVQKLQIDVFKLQNKKPSEAEVRKYFLN